MGIKTIGLSILGVSTAGGMAAGGYFFMQPKNIKDLLIQDKLNPLDISETSKDEDKWGELVKLHKGENGTITLKGGSTIKLLLQNKDLTATNSDGIKKLKEECKKLFEKK